ncbi:na+/H+ antiporter NhaD and related arsenite permeases [Clostridium sp. CAG:448]|nr:na+/H+ antiporter NhaD and related arsenite permeases [Clostridium sp. CAG:448]
MTTNRPPAPAAQRQPGKLAQFLRKNTVFVIALLAAVVTAFFVPPDAQYLSYFDWKTLSCLFCTLAVICALRNIHFFTVVAHKIVGMTGNIRRAIIAIIMITFIGSMLIANDMALLTFLPLGYHVLASSGQKKHMVFTFIMQNIGANLGGMLTPFGNPQNLYLYNKFQIPTAKFMGIMAIPFAAAIFLILVCCLILIRPEPIRVENQEDDRLPVGRTVLYLLLFAFSIVIVFRLIPYYIGLIVIPAVLLFADRKALRNVDYFLLLTFACFFVFSGNMARIDGVNRVLSSLMAKNPLIVSILSCQVISNVPSAILLSGFTTEYRALLYGVNIGGTGTLIASLASLITFRQYTALEPAGTKRYLGVFTLLNFLFLAVMTGVCVLLLQ